MNDTALLDLFTNDIGTAEQLLELIDSEFQALTERDLPRLDSLLSEKQPLLALLQQHGNERSRLPQRDAPSSSIPAKRSADSRAHDNPAKRSTNAAEEAWVADEDRFVLQQAKKKAALRVKGGRARPIDWLAVTLRFIDPTEKSILDEEVEDHELDIVDPEGVLEGLSNDDI